VADLGQAGGGASPGDAAVALKVLNHHRNLGRGEPFGRRRLFHQGPEIVDERAGRRSAGTGARRFAPSFDSGRSRRASKSGSQPGLSHGTARYGADRRAPSHYHGGSISVSPSTEHLVLADIGQSSTLACDHCGNRGGVAVIRQAPGGSVDPVVNVIAFILTKRDGSTAPAAVAIRSDLNVSPRELAATADPPALIS